MESLLPTLLKFFLIAWALMLLTGISFSQDPVRVNLALAILVARACLAGGLWIGGMALADFLLIRTFEKLSSLGLSDTYAALTLVACVVGLLFVGKWMVDKMSTNHAEATR